MKSIRFLISILVITVMIFGVLSIAYSAAMMSHGGMDRMLGCPLMGNAAALCPVNVFEHLSAWQNLFASVVAQNIIVLLLFLFGLFFLFRNIHVAHIAESPPRSYALGKFAVPYDDHLSRFMARGLLHPKIF